ncbi:hypothetical protein BCR44DRAFT_1441770 [Catenaria anguillulae PL171]|uniref:N-acetyltransferase domain-containing protein n=1 Tax=Catenaria anguillulae PL171 TaxID=765915 RepID=A0A1Y2HAT0_9FUNG|nr:hypothetical protein BCR44DRAFT_1441770 [Catenaria anguillulae PL171]
MLLAEADAMSVKHGCSRVSLHVAGNNTRAKQLYERVGYVEDKRKSIRGSVQRAVSRFCVGEDGFFYLTKALDA